MSWEDARIGWREEDGTVLLRNFGAFEEPVKEEPEEKEP